MKSVRGFRGDYDCQLHQGNTESRNNLEQNFIFEISTLNSHGINGLLLFE